MGTESHSARAANGGLDKNSTLGEGRLSVLAITFFVVSAAGPLVAMAGGIPVTMLFGNGAGIPALFLGLTLVLLLFATGYTEMAREIRHAGAFYALVRAGLGLRMGGATGLIALVSYNAIQVGLYGMFGAAADSLIGPAISHALPWWAYAMVAMLTIGLLGYRQIDLSVRLLGLLCACEYLVVIALDVCIVAQGGSVGLSFRPFEPDAILSGAPMIGLMLSFGAFIGFEATTIYSEEARDPERSIPRATYISLLVIGIFYTLSSWALVMAVGPNEVSTVLRSLKDPTVILFDIANQYAGIWLVDCMRILFVTSIYAAMLAFHNAIARYFFSLGRDNILPSIVASGFGRSHQTFSSPHKGSVAQSILAFLAIGGFGLAGSDPVLTVFTLPTAVGTLGVLMLMILASLAVISFFISRRQFVPKRALPALFSTICLSSIGIFAAFRFDVLAGSGAPVVAALPCLLIISALLGFAAARA